MTRDALLSESFSNDAVKMVQVSNCYNDGFVALFETPYNFGMDVRNKVWEVIDQNSPGHLSSSGSPVHLRFHFDWLPDYDALEEEWTRLENSTYVKVKAAEQKGDLGGFACSAGVVPAQRPGLLCSFQLGRTNGPG